MAEEEEPDYKYEACEEYEGPLPKVKIFENSVMVHCLPSDRYSRLLKANNSLVSDERIMSELMRGKAGKSIGVILNYIETHSEITTEVVTEITNKSEAQARRYLNSLEKASQEANAQYNEILYYGFGDEE